MGPNWSGSKSVARQHPATGIEQSRGRLRPRQQPARALSDVPGGRNLRWGFEDARFLVVEIPDLSKNFGGSSTGKTITVASSCGHKMIQQTGALLSVNAYLRPGTEFDESGLAAFQPRRAVNMDVSVGGGTLRLSVDLSVAGKPSSCGKTRVLASTQGDWEIGDSNIILGCQVMTKPDVTVDLSCLAHLDEDEPAAKRPGHTANPEQERVDVRRPRHTAEAEDEGSPGIKPPRHGAKRPGHEVDVEEGPRHAVREFAPHFFPEGQHHGSFAALLAALDEARSTMDIAIYMLTDNDLAHMVVRKHEAGVKVRIVCDGDVDKDTKTSDISEIEAAGVEVRRESTKLLMHHKFAVIDSRTVINGSFNWTAFARMHNWENLVVSQSVSLAAAFKGQFEGLWAAFAPGGDGRSKLSRRAIFADGCAALFFPDKHDENLHLLLDELRTAKTALDVCVFTLTMRDVVQVMKDLHRRGVKVRVISDDRCSTFRHGEARRDLEDAGIAYRTDASRFHMHHKFAVIDGRTLINGSFNWTRQAENGNNEDLVIYRGAPKLVGAFQREFERLWKEFS